MKRKQEIGVVGLGKFGFFVGRRLMELGHDVVGLDVNPDNVRRAQDHLTQVYQGDGTDKGVLEQLGFKDFDHVVVSVGEAMEASILLTMHLKELEARQVWVKAISLDHEKVLRKVGADEVFFPELFGSQQLAMRITSPGLIEYLHYGQGILVQKLVVDQWRGRTLRELNLTNRYQMLVIAHRSASAGSFDYLPRADARLEADDEIVVVVQEEMAGKFQP
ncbi:TrkA family potassium uptake protein [Desulfocurvus sp.]|jgi:trk system potassium uptake protein TrkA|uniref:potassium channel family protein n=1 Tax=Desulfocurvus sp. TaxID=2871698 RepID=UPI0025BBB182|nr:TrkA family potassium uptake protein [Desulfocurvus sp.]MCK9240417.1 TrkA family potassium uptake protein [Desulfocurvus sp.]